MELSKTIIKTNTASLNNIWIHRLSQSTARARIKQDSVQLVQEQIILNLRTLRYFGSSFFRLWWYSTHTHTHLEWLFDTEGPLRVIRRAQFTFAYYSQTARPLYQMRAPDKLREKFEFWSCCSLELTLVVPRVGSVARVRDDSWILVGFPLQLELLLVGTWQQRNAHNFYTHWQKPPWLILYCTVYCIIMAHAWPMACVPRTRLICDYDVINVPINRNVVSKLHS